MKETILGIETSCDETAVSVYNSDRGVLSNSIYSQAELHTMYGGVVPEIASRSHLEKIRPIITSALDEAQVTLDEITTVAVTSTPGLPGSLLVGLSFAKAVSWAGKKKLVGVNHLEGHVFSACIENSIPFPFLCITASGGHTAMYLVTDYGQYQLIGQTLDDAAGEAFDKIAKFIRLSFAGHVTHGGPLIESLAREAGFVDFFHYPRPTPHSLDFSFSGLKTAILYDLAKRGAYDVAEKKFLKEDDRELQKQVASSMLVCIADTFEQKLKRALELHPTVKAIAFVGGVACNKYIRSRLTTFADKHALPFFTPSPAYCTDNGAMIAFVGHYKAMKQEWSDFSLDI